jgi:hypothetical protein
MGGALGWPPSEVRTAALAELWACWIGHGRVQGWFERETAEPMTRDRLQELMEAYPDV